MGRNEIRLRRHRLTGKGSERFRNYAAVLQRHEREMRMKKMLRVVTMFLIILILISLIFFISQVERKATEQQNYRIEKIMRMST
jgi:uncharacterized membrane protein YvbJ